MNALKRRLVLLTATLWSSLCLALPAPHDIAQAVALGQLSQSDQMLREVIAEKPGSAKAHYELAQVLAREGQHSQALQEIHQARALDPSLQFAQSPGKFNAVMHAIEQQASVGTAQTAPTGATAPATATEPAHAQSSLFWPVLLTGGFALLVLALWRRIQAHPALQPQAAGVPAGVGGYSDAPRGFGAQYDPRSAVSNGSNTYPSASSSVGSGVTGAVVGGLAGVAAGYALSKALEDHDRPIGHSDNTLPRNTTPMDDMGVVQLDNNPDQNLGNFDAGTGDSWDAPVTDNDNW